MSLRNITLSKRIHTQRVYTIEFHLYNVLKPVKLIYRNKNGTSGCLGQGQGCKIDARG